MGNAKKNCNLNSIFVFIRYPLSIYKFDWSTVNYWNKKELCFDKTNKKAKNLKIKFQQRGVKLKCSIGKKSILLQFTATLSNKILSAITSQNKIALTNPIKQYCYKQNQIVPSIIRLRSTTNRLKTKSTLLSVWSNYYYQSR